MYVIFTDTDTDLTPQTAKEYGYHLISMPYSIDGKEVFPYEDFDTYDEHAFYEMLRNGTMPQTSGLSPEKYKNYFTPFLQEGKDILYVHFSEAMSGTFTALKIAVDELKEEFPDRRIELIDTKAITIGSLNIVKEIGDLYVLGKTIDEIKKWAETEVDKFALYFFAEDLKFFRRSGRVGNFAAFFGNILGIHPIIYIGEDGKMTSIDKARGRKATIDKIINYVKELEDDIKGHRVLIAHTDAPETAHLLGEMVNAEFGGDLRIEYVCTNPTAGSHCGPNGVGISFHAKHR
ncbi:MAG: DegV family protein [Clostridia bacterium]|nr:DegV family protein [Clostridia bacterium]MBR1676775.1 DegV family protein [Clostridia bacterium]